MKTELRTFKITGHSKLYVKDILEKLENNEADIIIINWKNFNQCQDFTIRMHEAQIKLHQKGKNNPLSRYKIKKLNNTTNEITRF